MRRWSATFEKYDAATQVASEPLLDHSDYEDDDDNNGTHDKPRCGATEFSSDNSDHRGDDSDDEVFESGWLTRAKMHVACTLPLGTLTAF